MRSSLHQYIIALTFLLGLARLKTVATNESDDLELTEVRVNVEHDQHSIVL